MFSISKNSQLFRKLGSGMVHLVWRQQ